MAIETGLISYWKMDESVGNDRIDKLGLNDLEESGGTVAAIPGGKLGFAADLDATIPVLRRQNASIVSLDSDDFTVSMWVRMDTMVTRGVLVALTNEGHQGWDLAVLANGSVTTGGYDLVGVGTLWTGTSAVGLMKTGIGFQHVVITRFNGGAVRVYIDSIPRISVTSLASDFPNDLEADDDFVVGSRGDTTFRINAAVDEMSFWNRELSSSEVGVLFNSGVGDFYDNNEPDIFDSSAAAAAEISIDWFKKIININKIYTLLIQSIPTEIRSLDIDQFRLDLKDFEDDDEGLPNLDTHQHVGPITVGGVSLARVVEIINGYTITFEDGQYAVNLVGANSNIGDVVNVNQVSIRSANSAGLTFSKEIQDQSFEDARVWIDTVNGQAGTQFPRGTPGDPVDNLPDAQAIIAARGLPKRLHLRGNITSLASDDLSEYDIMGDSTELAAIQFAIGTVTTNMVLSSCDISGTLAGEITAKENAAFTGLSNFEGKMINGGLAAGTVTLGDSDSDKRVDFLECHSQVAGSGTPILDCNSVSDLELNIRGYHGGLELINFDQATGVASIDLDAANLILASTCTAGVIIVRGVGILDDQSGAGCTVVQTGLVEGNTLQEIYRLHGLESGTDVVITDTSRVAGGISQTITDGGTSTTVSRP